MICLTATEVGNIRATAHGVAIVTSGGESKLNLWEDLSPIKFNS